MKRANIGSGEITVEGWDNFDSVPGPFGLSWDIRWPLWRTRSGIGLPLEEPLDERCILSVDVVDYYDYAVCSFMLQELSFHELPDALKNVRAILKPGGVLRILVADIVEAFDAFERTDEDWFPQDERTGDIAAKFCSYVTWFGTSKSVFVPEYLLALVIDAGFTNPRQCQYGMTYSQWPDIVDLDSRINEALILEVTK